MLNRIQEFFNTRIPAPGPNKTGDEAVNLATAALLVEVMLIDGKASAEEQVKISSLLAEQLDLSPADVNQVLQLAREEALQATSLFQFTTLVNKHLDRADKQKLVEGLWQVAYADGDLDKYEEGVIRRIADLIYVSHSNFLKAKHDVLARNRD